MASSSIELVRVRGATFLQWSTQWGRSDVAGPVTSQYEEALRKDEDGVQAFGLYTCGTPIGGYSVGVHALPRGGVAGRLDLVLCHPKVRGRGVGGLLMLAFVTNLQEQHAESLSLISAVAVHPAVQHVLGEKVGFSPASVSESVPLYQLSVAAGEHARLQSKVQGLMMRKWGQLKSECLTCQRFAWSDAWCVDPDASKPTAVPIPIEHLLRGDAL